MTKWDRFSSTIRRAHDDFEFQDVVIRNWSSSLDGDNRRTKDTKTETTVSGEVVAPQRSQRALSTGGEDSEVDKIIRIRDDTGVTIRPLGTEGEIATEVDDTETGTTYQVSELFEEGNGLLRLEVTEQ